MPRVLICRTLEGPDSLVLEERAPQPVAPGMVRVGIRAAGMNFPDLLMTRGLYQLRPDPPFALGLEAAGTITEAAPDIEPNLVGRRVIVGLRNGAFAEEVVVPAAHVLPLPDGFDFAEGATFRVAALTAWHALHQRAAIRAGETLAVLGAAGGVGMAAVEIGKLAGLTVIAVCNGPEKALAVRAKGADAAVDYSTEDLKARLMALTEGRGVDVIFDPVGGDAFEPALRAIAWGGRYLVIGFAGGPIPKLKTNLPLLKGASVIGVRAGEAGRQNPDVGRAVNRAILDLAGAGHLRPNISHRFAFGDYREAFRILEERRAIGRVALLMHD